LTRIALISDIHGNDLALEVALDDIHRERVDQIICLGDVATLGPQPREVIARLKALGCLCVMGNHDAFLLDPGLIPAYTTEPIIVETIEWCARQLTRADVDYLRSFLPSVSLSLDTSNTLLCFHGSPKSNTDNILATTPPPELDKLLEGQTATLLAGGHTHLQMLRQHKGALIVNPGSAGQPFVETTSQGPPRLLPWAEYAIVNSHNGVIGIELRRVPLDPDALRQRASASDVPLRGWLIQQYAKG